MHVLLSLLLLSLPQAADAPERSWPWAHLFVDVPGQTELSGRLIARPHEDTDGLAAELLAPALVVHYPEVREYVVRVPEGMEDEAFARELWATGWFEYVQPDWIVYPVNTVPNDPNYGNQWHHQTIQSELAWDLITDAAPVIAAWTDTGVDLSHPDLAANLLPGYNAVDDLEQTAGGNIQDINGHGTHVAGVIGALGNNGIGVAGVSWNVQLLPVRVSNSASGSAYYSDLEQGARWAVDNGAKTISASYSGVQGPSIQTTGAYVRSQGGLYFYAADNANQNHSSFDWADVVVVAGTDQNDNKASFSSYGLAVDCTGPAVDVWSTRLGGGYGGSSGTSFSTPMANGVAAMIFATNPYLDTYEVEERLYLGCVDLGAPGDDDIFGRGRIDLWGAVQAAAGGSMDLSVVNLTAGSTATFTADATAGSTVWFAGSLTGMALTDQPALSLVMLLDAPQLIGSATSAGTTATLDRLVPASLSGTQVWLQAVESGNGSNVVATTVN